MSEGYIYAPSPANIKKTENPSKKKYNADIKYTVCAQLDLMGFSSHLEIGADLRTNIGKSAIDRLNNLDRALAYIDEEKKQLSQFYPDEEIYSHRINDSLLIMMDINNFLFPSIGKIEFSGHSINDLKILFEENFPQEMSEEEFLKEYKAKANIGIESLSKYLGVVSRAHSFISKVENEACFPGVKTIVSTGYRRVYNNNKGEDDYLSANFAFSNSYLADRYLHGSKLFIDSNLLKILSLNKLSHNLLKRASIKADCSYHPVCEVDYKELRLKGTTWDSVEPINVKLFRKDYYFFPLDPNDLSYLQMIHNLAKDFEKLKKDKKIKKNFFTTAIQNLIKFSEKSKPFKGKGGLIFQASDISKKITDEYDLLLRGTLSD